MSWLLEAVANFQRKGEEHKRHKREHKRHIKARSGTIFYAFCAFCVPFPILVYLTISQGPGLNLEPLGSFLKVELVTRVVGPS